MIRIVLAAVLPLALLGASAAVRSAQWVHIGADARGNHWHMNAESIRHEAHRVTVWKRIDFRPPYPRSENGQPFRWAYVLNIIDCEVRHAHLKALSLLEPDGSVIAVQEDGGLAARWPSVTRVPIMRTAMAMVCDGSSR